MAKLVLTAITDNDHATTMNTNLDSIEAAIENTLSRDGSAPNSMDDDFDLNSNFILNMPAGTDPTHPLQYQQITELIADVTGGGGDGENHAVLTDATNIFNPTADATGIVGLGSGSAIDKAQSFRLENSNRQLDFILTTAGTGYGWYDYTEAGWAIRAIPSTSTVEIYGQEALVAADLTNFEYIGFDTAAAYGVGVGEIAWNVDEGTVDVGATGGQVVLQLGQETVGYVKAAENIADGDVVYASGAVGVSGSIEVSKFIANGTIPAVLVVGMATEAITSGEFGYVTAFGKIRGLDTTGPGAEDWDVGTLLYASPITAGALTNIQPFPGDQAIPIAFVIIDHAVNGAVYCRPTNPFTLAEQHDVSLTGAADNDLLYRASDVWIDTAGVLTWDGSDLVVPSINGLLQTDYADMQATISGTCLDTPALTVASNGSVITATFQKSGGGDVRIYFDTGVQTVDCTDPVATVALTPGTDANPTLNYIYVLESAGVLGAATSWPDGVQYAPVGVVYCQSAASAQTDGLLKVHAWTDHTISDETGHLGDLNYWVRHQPATWTSGCLLTANAGAATFDIATSVGEILQLHQHSMPAFDTAAASEVFIANDSVSAYLRVGDLTGITLDADGAALANKYFNVVVWGIVSEDDGDCQLMVNLPSGSYTASDTAQTDVSGTAVYTIPPAYRGVGFLISRLTMRLQGTTYTEVLNTDLRGSFPSTGAGGAGGTGGAAQLTELTDVDSATQTAGFVLTNDGGNYYGRALIAGDINAESSTDGHVLTSDGAGNAAWEAVAGGGGDVSKVGTPVNNELGVWTGDGTLEGESELTYAVGSELNVATHLVLPQTNEAATPTLEFGTTNTGIYAPVANVLSVSIAGVQKWSISATGINSAGSSGGLTFGPATATAPGLTPNSADTNTGIGWPGSDSLSLVAGGIEMLRCVESTTDYVRLTMPFMVAERATAITDQADYGQLWVKNTTPNELWFTGDTGTDQLIDPSVSDINTQDGNYTLVLGDKGKTIHKASGGVGETITIPANGSVAFRLGTLIGVQNDGGGDLSIAITTDTMTGTDGVTGTRTLGDNHTAVIQKMTATTWKYAASDL